MFDIYPRKILGEYCGLPVKFTKFIHMLKRYLRIG